MKNEIINDILRIVNDAIIKAQSFTIPKEIKTFKATRLNQDASQYTNRALVQIHRDLAILLASLDAHVYKEDVEWLNNRAKDIEKSNL